MQDDTTLPISPERQAEADELRNRSALYETLFQDDSGKIEEPVGQTCSRLLCFQIEDAEDQSLKPCFFWLSVTEGEHYRFFMDDALFVQWFRASAALLEQEISEDPDCILDLSLLYGLQGSKIVSVTVERVWQDSLYILCLTLLLSKGHSLRLEYAGDRTSMVVM